MPRDPAREVERGELAREIDPMAGQPLVQPFHGQLWQDPDAPKDAIVPDAVCTLKYYGGPLLQNAQIYMVNWGANVESAITTTMPNFYNDVVQSTYWDWLAEYNSMGLAGTTTNQGISRGTYAGARTITPSMGDCTTGTEPGCTIFDSDIQTELNAQITAGQLPAPAAGCDGQDMTIYMINFNPLVTLFDPSGNPSCNPANGTTTQAFCAYHGTATRSTGNYAYGVIPSMVSGPCANAGCGAAGGINNETAVTSHELAEAATDTDVGLATTFGPPLAWYANATNCGEIGDICNGQQATITVGGATWTVQKLYDNASHSCITGKTSLPICTTTGGTGCRKCACSDDAAYIVGNLGPGPIACTGGTAWCSTETTDVKGGLCVQCTQTSQCPTGDACLRSTTSTDDTCVTCITTCPAPDNCGTISNGCGGTINCGSCTGSNTCGGGGTPNVCGCTPITTCPAPDNCGTISNGCGGTINCGTCTGTNTCGGGGTPNVCGCTPITTCPAPDNCGTISNGCGGTVNCGTCTGTNTCGGGGTPNVCGCTPI
ncbi:MAG TPA: hypothetical protein VF765_27240, partial [Polyangiaceae bacterium]